MCFSLPTSTVGVACTKIYSYVFTGEKNKEGERERKDAISAREIVLYHYDHSSSSSSCCCCC